MSRTCSCGATDPCECARRGKRADTFCPCECHKANCAKCGHPIYWHSQGQCGCCDPTNNYCVGVRPEGA
jgi:hypothetical protein